MYAVAAVADLALLIVGYLIMRRTREHIALGVILSIPMMIGIVYLILFVALFGPACPNGRWAC